jgi:hypothetical protein
MSKFIITTIEGDTFSPLGIHVENLQVLGLSDNVENEQEAMDNLLLENPWIIESGFDPDKFIYQEIIQNNGNEYILSR